MKFNYKLLEFVHQITTGEFVPHSLRLMSGTYRVISPKNILYGNLKFQEDDYFIDLVNSNEEIIKQGDVLISLIGPDFNSVVISELHDQPMVANQNVAIIRSNNNHYINAFLNSNIGKKILLEKARQSSTKITIPKITLLELKNITIPIFQSKDLNKLVSINASSKSIYETEIIHSLIQKLEFNGWQVKKQDSFRIDFNSVILDIALYKDGIFETFIEIKRESRNVFFHFQEKLIEQLDKQLSITKAKYAYCFFEGRLFKYFNGKFLAQNDFPAPKLHTESSSKLEYEFFREILEENIRLKEELKNSKDSIEKKFLQISDDLYIIKNTTARTEEKIDAIIHLLTNLVNGFNETKTAATDLTEKVIKLNKQLDKSISELLENNKVSIATYQEILEEWFSFEWDKFEELSKSYLPSAEYLFDNLQKLNNPDLSPFILQYCRALENELLNKIFRNYVKSINNRNIDFEELFSWDLALKENRKPNNESSNKFARHIQKCLRVDESKWFFELGTMRIYLEYLTGKTADKSPILKDFKAYLLSFFNSNILDAEFLIKIKETTEEFRNKAAHPNKISTEEATKGKMMIKNLLKCFLEYYQSAT